MTERGPTHRHRHHGGTAMTRLLSLEDPLAQLIALALYRLREWLT